MTRLLVAVCGSGVAAPATDAAAERAGALLARAGAVVVCGGLGGVMAAAARGAAAEGGIVIGLLPGDDAEAANPHCTVAIPTGLGEMRNALIARCCRGMVAIGGGTGTLSEVALALRLGRPVAVVDGWDLQPPPGAEMPPLHRAGDADEAVRWILDRVR